MIRAKIPLVSCRGLIGDTARVRRCLLEGFFAQCAQYDHTGLYLTLRDGSPFVGYFSLLKTTITIKYFYF